MSFELAVAFFTGAVSFLSPCIIPMVMVYLTTITGFSFEALTQSSRSPQLRRQVFLKTLVFVLSFTLVFTLIGALAAVLGGALPNFFGTMSLIAGALFVLLALHYFGVLRAIFWRFGGMMEEGQIEKLAQKWKGKDGTLSYAGVFAIGLAFALVCSHCISPTLFPTLLLASSMQSATGGAAVMLSFSLGLGAAFLLAALFFSQAMSRLKWIAAHKRAVNYIVGAIFLLFGLLLLSGSYLQFISLLYSIIPWKLPGM